MTSCTISPHIRCVRHKGDGHWARIVNETKTLSRGIWNNQCPLLEWLNTQRIFWSVNLLTLFVMYDYACICIIIRFHVTIGTVFAVFAYYKRYIYWNMLKTNGKIVHNKIHEWMIYTNVVVFVAFLTKVLNNSEIIMKFRADYLIRNLRWNALWRFLNSSLRMGISKKKITVLQYDTNKDKLWLRFIAIKENTC